MNLLSGGRTSHSGVVVTESTALRASAVLACVKIISETLASLPLHTYERTDRGKERATKHPNYRLLHTMPHPEMDSFIWRELLGLYYLVWGNGYSIMDIGPDGRVKEFSVPIIPDRVQPRRTLDGKKFYTVTFSDGHQENVPRRNMFHIQGLSLDGEQGVRVVRQWAREAIGLSLATEEFTNRFFANGANVGTIVEHPEVLSPEGVKNLEKKLNDKYTGLKNAHKLMLLDEGMKIAQTIMKLSDAQSLETRKFQVEEIARIFRVPLHLLQSLDRATNNNIEHQGIDFVVHTMRPHLVRWEMAYNTQTFLATEQDKYFSEFNIEGLLRGDIKSRYEAYAIGKQWGWLNSDEIRAKENMNEMPDNKGKIYLQPLNMVEAGTQPQPKPTQDLDPEPDPDPPPKQGRYKFTEQEIRAAVSKTNIARSYERVFQDAVARIVRRERVDIMRAAKSIFEDRSKIQNFHEFLNQFYDDPDYVRKQLAPPVSGLSEAISAEAAEEVGGDVTEADTDKFVSDYTDAAADRYNKRSKGQLSALVDEAWAEGEDILAALDQRFVEWEERRPGKVAQEETVRISGAISKFVFGALGVTKLRWVNTGNKSCPYCESLNGKIVGVEDNFLQAGEFAPEGADHSIKIRNNIGHPPLHSGCVCVIQPERS